MARHRARASCELLPLTDLCASLYFHVQVVIALSLLIGVIITLEAHGQGASPCDEVHLCHILCVCVCVYVYACLFIYA